MWRRPVSVVGDIRAASCGTDEWVGVLVGGDKNKKMSSEMSGWEEDRGDSGLGFSPG